MRVTFPIGLLLLATGRPLAAQDPAALAAQVRAAESSFARTMAARDFAAFATFVAEEAVFFGSTTVQHGRAEVLDAWRPYFEGPDAPFSWTPETVEVLASGRLAHSSGPVFDAAGRRVGTFNSIWRRDPDGRWLVVFDKGCACPCAGGS